MTVKADSPEKRPAGPAPDAGERQLVDRFRAGDRAAFARLVEMHEDRIARLASRLLGWHGEVEDVVQEVFVRCLEHLPKFRWESGLVTWLSTLTINECRRRRRRLWSWLSFFHRNALERSDSHMPADALPMQQERSECVRHAVRELPAKYREVVVLRYLEGMEVEEICRVLRLSRSSVDVKLHRAREQLRDVLADLIEEEA